MPAAVDVAAKVGAVLAQFAQRAQAENLKAAGIGEHRSRPGHELVQATRLLQEFLTGSQVEMVGVAQNDGGIHLEQIASFQGFDAGTGADGHEDGSGNLSV